METKCRGVQAWNCPACPRTIFENPIFKIGTHKSRSCRTTDVLSASLNWFPPIEELSLSWLAKIARMPRKDLEPSMHRAGRCSTRHRAFETSFHLMILRRRCRISPPLSNPSPGNCDPMIADTLETFTLQQAQSTLDSDKHSWLQARAERWRWRYLQILLRSKRLN